MQKISYYIFFCVVWTIMWLPLPIIHLLANFFYLLNVYIFKYRKKVVITNLKNSFPEKSKKEIYAIYKKFFMNFFEMLVESIYTIHLSQKDINSRVTIHNSEAVNELIKKGKSITMLSSHYGNWEWSNSCGPQIDADIIFIYQKLNNKYANKFWKNLRTKYGALAYSTDEVFRKLMTYHRNSESYCMLTLADQCPTWANINHWQNFLNQDTGWNNGFTRIAKKFNHAIVFAKFDKTKRGHYDITFEILTEDSKDYSIDQLMNIYITRLETIIKEKPELWLWSHKRWKRQQKDL